MAAVLHKFSDPAVKTTHALRLKETEMILFSAVENLLQKTGVQPDEVRVGHCLQLALIA